MGLSTPSKVVQPTNSASFCPVFPALRSHASVSSLSPPK